MRLKNTVLSVGAVKLTCPCRRVDGDKMLHLRDRSLNQILFIYFDALTTNFGKTCHRSRQPQPISVDFLHPEE
jgi:hypothetical protein